MASDDAPAVPTAPHSWVLPGFRRGSLWRRAVAVFCYFHILVFTLMMGVGSGNGLAALLFLTSSMAMVAVLTNYLNLSERLPVRPALAASGLFILGVGAFIGAAASSDGHRAQADIKNEQTAGAPSEAQVKGDSTSQARASALAQEQANATAAAAASHAEAVDLLGAAVSQRQAGELGLALELSKQAQAKWSDYADAKSFMAEVAPQATSQARAAATAQAQVQATGTAQAQAAAQAAAATATARANLPVKMPGCVDLSGLQVCVSLVGRSQGSQFNAPKLGQEFVVVNVEYKNNSKEEKSFNPNDFDLVDNAGVIKTYDWFGPQSDRVALGSGQLIPGGQTRGQVSFQVPKGDTAFVLRYRRFGFFGGSVLARWSP
jgi:nucleoid-associated protein YgaU